MARHIQLNISGFENRQDLRHKLVPSEVLGYQDLENQASTLYSQIFPFDRWTVSFRLRYEDAFLEEHLMPIQADLWNNGTYLKFMWAKDGMLEVVAYFVPKSETGLTGFPKASGDLSMMEYMERASSTALTNIPTISIIPNTPPTSPTQASVSTPTMGPNIMPKVATIEALPHSQHVSRKRNHNTMTQETPTSPSPVLYPPLPPTITPSTFQPTLAGNLLADVPPTHLFHVTNRNWSIFTPWRKKAVAKALMIAGLYGVDAHKPCACCVKHGRECRIWHPDIRMQAKWRVVNSMKAKGREGGSAVSGMCCWCLAKPTWKIGVCDAE
ncbi:hypothetical protein G6011_00729 [Alternaria panax]|uniref:Uncharacterized protein n=1 Tax=Alternaria panax TaxID=48097 RepID=A0AAD4NV85_9PLEO|nr:hypothetical protein G6011_00729 [Alternaria panax]